MTAQPSEARERPVSCLATPLPVTAPAARRWQQVDDLVPDPDAARYTQGALALTYPLPSGLDAQPNPAGLSLVGDHTTEPDLPDPMPWATRLVQAVVEVVSSDRPLTQLARWVVPDVYLDLSRRRDQVARHRKPGQVRSSRQQVATVHVWQPSTGTAEVAARVAMGQRSRAIAARLQFEHGRWLCTALEFG
jgi:hypothetical protein